MRVLAAVAALSLFVFVCAISELVLARSVWANDTMSRSSSIGFVPMTELNVPMRLKAIMVINDPPNIDGLRPPIEIDGLNFASKFVKSHHFSFWREEIAFFFNRLLALNDKLFAPFIAIGFSVEKPTHLSSWKIASVLNFNSGDEGIAAEIADPGGLNRQISALQNGERLSGSFGSIRRLVGYEDGENQRNKLKNADSNKERVKNYAAPFFRRLILAVFLNLSGYAITAWGICNFNRKRRVLCTSLIIGGSIWGCSGFFLIFSSVFKSTWSWWL